MVDSKAERQAYYSQLASNAKASAEAAAMASGSTSYSYYDRGILKQVNVPSTREKLLSAAVQTGQGFGQLGGTTVESRAAYASSLGFSGTEVKTALGQLPFGASRAEKQQITQEALRKVSEERVLNKEEQRRVTLIKSLREREVGQAPRQVLSVIGREVPQGIGLSVFNLPQRTRAVQETFTPAFAQKARQAEEGGERLVLTSAFAGKLAEVKDFRTPEESAKEKKEILQEQIRRESERRVAFGLPPIKELGKARPELEVPRVTRPEVVPRKEGRELTTAERLRRSLFGKKDIFNQPREPTPEFLKPTERVVQALVGGFVGGAVGLTPSEQRKIDKIAEESERLQKLRLASTVAGLISTFGSTGGVSRTVRGARAVLSYGERALARLGLRGAERVAVKTAVREVAPVVERGISQFGKAVQEDRIVSDLVDLDFWRNRLGRTVQKITPKVVRGIRPVVEAGVGVARPTVASRAKQLALFLATPQALAEAYVIQRGGTGVAVEAISKSVSPESVVASQKASAIFLEAMGRDIYERDVQGRIIGRKEGVPEGFIAEVKAGAKAEPTFKGAAKAFGEAVKRRAIYGGIGGLGGGEQFLAFASRTFGSGELAEEREQAIRSVGLEQGLSGEELEKFIKKTKRTGALLQTTEGVTTVFGVERVSEILGMKKIAGVFASREGLQLARKETAKKLFFAVAPTFAVAGAVEGGFQYETQLKTRGGERTLKGELVSIGGGALISTVLGGGAVSFAATRPTLSKVFSTVGQALEFPYEKFGDITAAAQVKIFRRLGVEVLEPKIKPIFSKAIEKEIKQGIRVRPSPSAAGIFEFAVSGRKPSTSIRVRAVGVTPSPTLQFASQAQLKTQAQLREGAQNVAKSLELGSRVTVPVKARVGFKVPSFVKIEEPIKTEEKVKIKEQVKPKVIVGEPATVTEPVKTEPTVTTPVEAFVGINIPVQTNVFGLRGFIPPPLPFPLGDGSGTGKATRKLFANELLASQNLFRQQLAFGIKNLGRPVGKKPKKEKGKKPSQSQERGLVAKQLSFGLRNLFSRGKK